jgi:hypothetical protein
MRENQVKREHEQNGRAAEKKVTVEPRLESNKEVLLILTDILNVAPTNARGREAGDGANLALG